MRAMQNRLKELRERAGMSQEALGDKVGASKQQISMLENGHRRLTQDWLVKLSQALGVSVAHLLGEAPTTSPPASEVRPADDHQPIAAGVLPRDVPVLGTAVGGAAGDFEVNGDVVDMVRRPPGLAGAKGIFALYVQNDSMAPWRMPGGLVYINPNKPARPGDHVVVELKASDGEPRPAFLKKLVSLGGSSIRLEQYNPPRDDLYTPANLIHRILRVIEWEEMLGI